MNDLVKPGHRYEGVKNPPLDPVRMAWPFKTKEELEILSKWFKKEERNRKIKEEKLRQEVIKKAGEAFL